MSIASLQDSLRFCVIQKSELTSSLTSVMSKLTQASGRSLETLEKTTEKKEYYTSLLSENPEYADTTEYQELIQAVDDDYALQMAEINDWESQLELEKSQTETQLKEITTTQESYSSALKSNIGKDFKYGQS